MLKELLQKWAEWRFKGIVRKYPDVAKSYVMSSKPYIALQNMYSKGMKDERQRYSRLEENFAKEAEKYQESENKIKEQGFLIAGLQKGLEGKIGELQKANDTIAELKNKIAEYDPALLESYKKQIKDLTTITAWNISLRNEARRSYRHLKAQVRKQAHQSCVSANLKREKDIVVVLSHAGWIADMTPPAEKLFGDLRGRYYHDLIDGSDSDKEKIGERLTSLIPIKEELIYINSLRKRKKEKGEVTKEKGQVAKINVYPEFFDEETVDGKIQEVRHSTIIEFEQLGWLGAWRMYRSGKKCMQDRLAEDLKGVKTNGEVVKIIQEASQGAKEASAEIDKRARGKNK